QCRGYRPGGGEVPGEPGHAVGHEPVRGAREGASVDGLHGLEPQTRGVAKDEPLGDLDGRAWLDRPFKQPGRGPAATAQAVAEPGARADAVHQHRVLGDERSAAAAGDNEVFGGQRGDRLAHGVAVHAEALGEFALSGQLRPWRLLARDDLTAQLLGNEPPGGISTGGSALRRHSGTLPVSPGRSQMFTPGRTNRRLDGLASWTDTEVA